LPNPASTASPSNSTGDSSTRTTATTDSPVAEVVTYYDLTDSMMEDLEAALDDAGGNHRRLDVAVDANRHDIATIGLTAVLRSAVYGTVLTSDSGCDNTLTLTYRRTGRPEDAVELGRRLRGVDP
jgi:hypothetical protein